MILQVLVPRLLILFQVSICRTCQKMTLGGVSESPIVLEENRNLDPKTRKITASDISICLPLCNRTPLVTILYVIVEFSFYHRHRCLFCINIVSISKLGFTLKYSNGCIQRLNVLKFPLRVGQGV